MANLKSSINTTPEPVNNLATQVNQPTSATPEMTHTEERIKDRMDLQTAAGATKNNQFQMDLSSPERAKEIFTQMKNTRLVQGLTKRLPEIDNRMIQLQTNLKLAEDKYKEDKDSATWADIAQTIGQAMVQLGAGAYGLKHNVNMAGLKFDKKNWSENIDRSLKELARKTSGIEKETTALGAEKAGIEDRAIREGERAEALSSKERIAQTKATRPTTTKPTEFEKVVEKKGAETAEAWIKGGRAAYKEDTKKLESAIDDIESGKASTGGIKGQIPRDIRLLYANVFGNEALSKGVQTELKVISVVQKSMREILGGQFAQKEGENLVKSMFNPGLPKDQLIENIRSIKLRLDSAANAKDKLAKHLAAGGTLANYEKGATKDSWDAAAQNSLLEEGKTKEEPQSDSKVEIKEVNGTKYKKVKGGWQKVQ
jgi:hypothetical protein